MFPYDYKGAALLFVGKNSNKNADILLNTLLPTGHTHCCIVFCDSSDGQRLVFVSCDKPEVTKDRCTFDAKGLYFCNLSFSLRLKFIAL